MRAILSPRRLRCQALYLALPFLAPFVTVSGLEAQTPSEPWRTLEIPGFRFHTPEQSEPWAREVASRMASIRHLVSEEVGFDPAADPVDVLVVDPIARANGTAWPVLGTPRLVLYTTPPPSHGSLGHFHDWPEILAVHEVAHLAHLLRPSRNPWAARFERLIPVGPLPRKAPNWAIEGYATLLEGRLTGWGRPNGDLRAMLLRRWAQAGRLPTYGALSGDAGRWLGRSFPYFVGSAYLEWLQEKAGDDALRKLWARLSARRERTFDDAFRGVFGDSPSRLYQRFCAEMTYRAMELEARRSSHLVEGELWQDLAWHTGPPAVSQDGKRLAAVLRRRGVPSTLVIWSTDDDPKPLERFEAQRRELAEKDPQDVPSVLAGPLPRDPLFKLPTRHGAEPFRPRFAFGDESVFFLRYDPAPEGTGNEVFAGATVPDIYRWWPDSDRVERVTEGASIQDFDPHPDGRRAIGTRARFGVTELVWIDLQSGKVTPIKDVPDLEPSIGTVWSHPRVSPDGSFLAYLRHTAGTGEAAGWQLMAHRLQDGALVGRPLRLPTPPSAGLAQPAWLPSGRGLVVAVAKDGFQDLWQYDLALGGRRRITQVAGGASAPAPSPDGRLFFLALEDDGFDLRVMPGRENARPGESSVLRSWIPTSEDVERLAPILRPAPIDAPEILSTSVPSSRDYGTGPREWLPLVGGSWTGHGSRIELGLRQGDPVGRLDVQLLASISDELGTEDGLGLALRWRRRSWDVGLRAFGVETPVDIGPTERHRGLLVSLSRTQVRHGFSISRRLAFLEHRGRLSGIDFERRAAILAGTLAGWRAWGTWSLRPTLDLELQMGETEGRSWQKGRAGLGAVVATNPPSGLSWRLGLHWRYGESENLRSLIDRSSVDLYRLGGTSGSLVPESVLSRWDVPALPNDVWVGHRIEKRRLDLEVGALPFKLFAERHRIHTVDGERALRLVGLDLSLSRPAMPLLRLPGFEVDLGLAQILDPPFEDQTEGWVRLRWRP